MFIKKVLCGFFLVLNMLYAHTQEKQSYQVLQQDTVALKTIFRSVSKNYESEIAGIKGKDEQALLDFYRKRFDNIESMFKRGEILSDDAACKYLDKLSSKVIAQNAALQSTPLQLAFSRSAVPNAASYGNGFIAMNAGLFCRLQSESQLAFVLCHEIAHQYLRHNDNSIRKYLETINSKETNKELAKISQQEFRQKAQAESLLKQITFNHKKYSRANETEADSLAVILMYNAGFDTKDALSCLALLDTIDGKRFEATAMLKTIFNSAEYAFKDRWLEKEEGLLGGHAVLEEDKQLEDSMKTHPDCSLRITQLQPSVTAHAVNVVSSIDTASFHSLQQSFPYQVINYYYTSEQYSRCIYYSLEILSKKPTDALAITYIGKAMNGIHEAEKNHSLEKVADLPSPYYSPNYNMVLQFIQNLRLGEVALANYYFLKNYSSSLADYNEYAKAFAKSKQIAEK